MNMRKKFLLTIAAFVLALTSCQNKGPDAPSADPINQNYILLDRGDYDGAIASLTQLAQTDSRPRVKEMLASAYAGRAGIQVQNYWGFVIGFKNPLVRPDDLNINPTVSSLQRISKQMHGRLTTEQESSLENLVRVTTVWEQYKDRIDAIPVVEGKALDDLTNAVSILDQVQTPGSRLYRAILELIIFKSYLQASQDLWAKFGETMQKVVSGDLQALCHFDFELMQEWLEPISDVLLDTLSDLQIAFPEKQADFSAAADFISHLRSFADKALNLLKQKGFCSS